SCSSLGISTHHRSRTRCRPTVTSPSRSIWTISSRWSVGSCPSADGLILVGRDDLGRRRIRRTNERQRPAHRFRDALRHLFWHLDVSHRVSPFAFPLPDIA